MRSVLGFFDWSVFENPSTYIYSVADFFTIILKNQVILFFPLIQVKCIDDKPPCQVYNQSLNLIRNRLQLLKRLFKCTNGSQYLNTHKTVR